MFETVLSVIIMIAFVYIGITGIACMQYRDQKQLDNQKLSTRLKKNLII